MDRRAGTGLCAALAALALGVAPAQGAVTLGETQSANTACSVPTAIEVQTGVAAGTNPYTVPAGGGVITSWSHQARQISGAMLKLKVVRRVSGATFQAVGESSFQLVETVDLHTFPTRIPVQAGDFLALGTASNAAASPPACFIAQPPSGVAGEELFDGQDFTTTNTLNGPFQARINVEAKLEPDADGDGFGDETQDACPSDASTQGTCPTGGGGGLPGGGTGGGGTGGGGGTTTVPGTQEFERALSLDYSKKQKAFDGEITSDEAACETGKVTVFEKVKGKDDKVGSDRSAAGGEYEVDEKAGKGTYYAQVGESDTGAGTCLTAKSKNEKVG